MPTNDTAEGVALSELINHTHQMLQFIFANDKKIYIMLTVTSESELSPHDIPIVNEYLDVFPPDITSLPQKEKLNFLLISFRELSLCQW